MEFPTFVTKSSSFNFKGVHYEKVKKLNPDVLKYTHTPVFIWFMGIVFIIMGSYLIYHVSGGVKARLFDGFKEG